MATIKGLGVVWSHGAMTFTGAITSSSTVANLIQTAKLNRSSDKTYVKGPGGAISAIAFSGFLKKLSLTIVPHGGSAGGALAAGVTSLDTHVSNAGVANTIIGEKVVVVDATGATLLDGNWICTDATQNKTVDGVATVDLELENGDEGTDLSTSVT